MRRYNHVFSMLVLDCIINDEKYHITAPSKATPPIHSTHHECSLPYTSSCHVWRVICRVVSILSVCPSLQLHSDSFIHILLTVRVTMLDQQGDWPGSSRDLQSKDDPPVVSALLDHSPRNSLDNLLLFFFRGTFLFRSQQSWTLLPRHKAQFATLKMLLVPFYFCYDAHFRQFYITNDKLFSKNVLVCNV